MCFFGRARKQHCILNFGKTVWCVSDERFKTAEVKPNVSVHFVAHTGNVS